METRSQLSELIEKNYKVLDKTIRKNSGSHSLKVDEFNNVGIRRVIVSKTKLKGVCLEFWSIEEQAAFLSEKIGINQGSKSSSHCASKYLDSLQEAKDLLQEVLKVSGEYSEYEVKEIDDEYNRSEIEENALSKISPTDKAKYNGFWEISKKLNTHLGSIFHVDHATSIKHGRESAITYKNLQIIIKGINVSKNDSSWDRFTYEQQREHILSCSKLIPGADHEYINFTVEQLRLYWD